MGTSGSSPSESARQTLHRLTEPLSAASVTGWARKATLAAAVAPSTVAAVHYSH
jgi:hypothetical protein